MLQRGQGRQMLFGNLACSHDRGLKRALLHKSPRLPTSPGTQTAGLSLRLFVFDEAGPPAKRGFDDLTYDAKDDRHLR